MWQQLWHRCSAGSEPLGNPMAWHILALSLTYIMLTHIQVVSMAFSRPGLWSGRVPTTVTSGLTCHQLWLCWSGATNRGT